MSSTREVMVIRVIEGDLEREVKELYRDQWDILSMTPERKTYGNDFVVIKSSVVEWTIVVTRVLS